MQRCQERELDGFNEKLKEVEEVRDHFLNEREKSQQIQLETETLFFEYKKACYEKEKKLLQEIGLYKGEVKEQLSQQKYLEHVSNNFKAQQEQVKILEEKNDNYQKQIQELQEIVNILSEEKNYRKQMEQNQDTKFQSEKQQYELQIEKLQLQVEDVKNAKDKQIEILKEKFIGDYTQLEENLNQNENQMKKLKQENRELKQNLSQILEKNQYEKQQRAAIEQVKSQIINTRNEELEKFNQAFSSFDQTICSTNRQQFLSTNTNNRQNMSSNRINQQFSHESQSLNYNNSNNNENNYIQSQYQQHQQQPQNV
ncbi:hypothetical protein PPERSA_03654 [Pseudocohnilembus persalinus]|uniref:Uncharacterized protein n=1 Tax=Pseudocohnilembus persalinus TaxID=266149 RepID=A0A0V0QNC6_PSEPJ|nr:hypothetical protein PPERSA_03654 [Pseudocohnilembus persalinus]|eukprot:KRX03693.1 hypothetical protein PPERSA_03654 [Pseudocohnilembus persalinus]